MGNRATREGPLLEPAHAVLRQRAFAGALVGALVVIASCSAQLAAGSDRGVPNDAAVDVSADTAASEPLDATAAADSPACVMDPGATPTEISATPRSDTELEFLAFAMGTRIVADDATYSRIVRDVAAVRTAYPALSDLHVRIPYQQAFALSADRATLLEFQAGTNRPVNCLNQQYVGTIKGDYNWALDGSGGSVTLTFKGLYAMDRLACAYRSVPGVLRIYRFPSALAEDGPGFFAWSEGDTFHYVFDHAGGDCPSGCTTHDASHYTTTPPGALTLVDSYVGDNSASPTWLRHQWYEPGSCLLW